MTPSALWPTVRVTYTQLGRILHIFYDSSPFNFLRLTFAVLFQIYFKLDYGKCCLCKYLITPLAPHFHRETTDRTYNTSELTTRMLLPVVRVKLVSMHRPFSNCAGSLATSNHLPMNYKGKTTQALKYLSCHQWRVWINLHTSVVSIKYAAGAPPNLFLTNRNVNRKI